MIFGEYGFTFSSMHPGTGTELFLSVLVQVFIQAPPERPAQPFLGWGFSGDSVDGRWNLVVVFSYILDPFYDVSLWISLSRAYIWHHLP